MTESAVPEIRFAGLEDSWQKLRLGNVGRAISGTGFPERYQGGKIGTPFYKVSDMNISGNEIKMNSAQNYVTDGQVAEMKFPVLSGPAICFAKVGAAVMKNRKRFVDGDFILDNNMMSYSLSSGFWSADFALYRFAQIDLTKLVQVGALPSYNATQVEAIETFVPTVGEQKAIGKFFRELDELLEAGEKKLEKLRQFKQSMLVKMFPQGDARTPEIRFAGFEGDWSGEDFEELFDFGRTVVLPREALNYKFGQGLNVHYGDILTKFSYWLTKEEELPFIDNPELVSNALARCLKQGDIIMADTAEDESVGRCVELRIDSGLPIFAGLHTYVLTPRKKFSPGYLGVFMNSTMVHEQIVRFSQGTKVTSISKENLKRISFLIPTYQEQARIAEYFRELEELLEAEEEKLEKLRQLKATFLQKMFV